MSKILCPTRGGAASYRTQDAAIELALERGLPLVFFYVVDTHFLDRTYRAVRPDLMEAEMERMGEFLLAMAQERARERGVEAEMRIRHGEFRDELVAAVREEAASVVLLGQPAGDESAFVPASLQALADQIAEETGAEVRIV